MIAKSFFASDAVQLFQAPVIRSEPLVKYSLSAFMLTILVVDKVDDDAKRVLFKIVLEDCANGFSSPIIRRNPIIGLLHN